MSFENYALTRFQKIAGVRYTEENIDLHMSLKFPVLSRRGKKHLLLLPEPHKTKKGMWYFEEMLFRDDEIGRTNLWQQFLASLDHLCLHTAVSNYSCYSNYGDDTDVNLVTFCVSIVEDALVDNYIARNYPDMLATQAYASALAFFKLRKTDSIQNDSLKIQMALLMKVTSGIVLGEISNEMQMSVEYVWDRLSWLKNRPSAFGIKKLNKDEVVTKVDEDKKNVVKEIYNELKKYGKSIEVASLPHQEHHGLCNIKTKINQKIQQQDFEKCFEVIYQHRGGKIANDTLSLLRRSSESMAVTNVFLKTESLLNKRKAILEKYQDVLKDTHFRSIRFPDENYEVYAHLRKALAGPIRRMSAQISQIYNELNENYGEKMGNIDLAEAVQVVASDSKNTDIFIRELPMKKNEMWSIMIDMSRSTSRMLGQTTTYATVLANVAALTLSEVVGAISSNEPWGMYGFNDSFYVIKDFDESYSKKIKARIGGIKHEGLSYLPDAIRVGAQIISEASMSDKNYFVFVSDGFPAGYSEIEDDLIDAIKTAEKRGVIILAVGLNTKYIKRFFKHSVVISSPKELMGSFVNAYMQMNY